MLESTCFVRYFSQSLPKVELRLIDHILGYVDLTFCRFDMLRKSLAIRTTHDELDLGFVQIT